MKKRNLRILYVFFDLITSAFAWTLFFFFRKIVIEKRIFGPDLAITPDNRLYIGLAIIPLFWFTLHYISGFYTNPLRRSRLTDLGQTLMVTLTGTIILFFGLLLDDVISKYTNYYLSFSVLFILQFILSYIPRFIITTITAKKIHNGVLGFNTLIIGCNGRATEIFKKIKNEKRSTGNKLIGCISISGNRSSELLDHLPCLGELADLEEILTTARIEEVIIALEPDESDIISKTINILNTHNLIVKAVPGMYDILSGRVKMSAILGTPLILLNADPLPAWQKNIKQLLDYFLSLIAFILLLPVSFVLALIIRINSKGPFIYKQERTGRHGKTFYLYKFRTMAHDAEKDGPQLSSENDPRVTKTGRFMRKHRLDEIPNFINVIKGDMSLVGPRPERAYYLEKIIERAPQYKLLLKIKPGITSWGQVKYGYASSVDEMIERLDYDLIYLENMSLYIDLKIMIYTLIIIFTGKGA